MGLETVAVDEMLHRSPWCFVLFNRPFDKLEGWPEFAMELGVAVADDWQAAALLRAVWREGRNDHMPPGFHRFHDLLDILQAIGRIGQKMENRPVMPNVICLLGKRHMLDVGSDPLDFSALRSEATTGNGERAGGKIEDR